MTPIVSLFNCSPREVADTPGLAEQLHAAGVTHLEADAVHDTDWILFCFKERFRVVLRGDNFMYDKTLTEKHCTREIVTDRARRWGGSGLCDGIEMVDEVGQDPRDYPMARQFVDWWRGAGGPLVAWPCLAPSRWLTGELSEYASPQWNWWAPKSYLPTFEGIKGPLRLERLGNSIRSIPAGWQKGAEIDASGEYGHMGKDGKIKPYKKRKPPSGLNIEKQIALAHSLGATRYRIWGYHCKRWQEQLANAKAGDEVFVGTHPGDRRWEFMARGIRGVREVSNGR